MSEPAEVFRENDRIRDAAGTGYSDSVRDETIVSHAAQLSEQGKWLDAAFCYAVLALRCRERAQ